MKRDKWREKHNITYAGLESEGGIVCVRDNWFIWCRYRDPGNTSHYRPILGNLELVYRNPSGFMEEMKIAELPYCRDSREDYLNTADSDCESDSNQDGGIGLLLALVGDGGPYPHRDPAEQDLDSDDDSSADA